MTRLEQRRRYRQRDPNKIKEQKKKYYEKKIIKKIEKNGSINEQELKLIKGFRFITRYKFDSILPKFCEICGSDEDLQIHHINYIYPINEKDLKRLCRRSYIEEHQRIHPPLNNGERL